MYYQNPKERAELARLRLEKWRHLLKLAAERYPDDTLCELLGSASVATMAELESFMRDLVETIVADINRTRCSISKLRPELHILHANSTYDSVRKVGTSNDSYWQSRIHIAMLHTSNEIASLPGPSRNGPQPPLRGNTISIRDISEVAKVFCFPHSAPDLVSGPELGALKKMSGDRNTFAHANTDPTEIFPNPKDDLERIRRNINLILSVIDTLSEEWEAVLKMKLFLIS